MSSKTHHNGGETHESATSEMKETHTDHDAHGSGAPETITTDTAISYATVEGQPNGLPPAAPEGQHEPCAEVIALREFRHAHVHNSVHSRDTAHLNLLNQHIETVCALLQSKHPVAKET